jgi:hypothetical protein
MKRYEEMMNHLYNNSIYRVPIELASYTRRPAHQSDVVINHNASNQYLQIAKEYMRMMGVNTTRFSGHTPTFSIHSAQEQGGRSVLSTQPTSTQSLITDLFRKENLDKQT